MRGITETELWMHRNNDMLDWDNRRAFDIVMRICPPKELTPWIPIADAPKDRLILLFYPEHKTHSGHLKPFITVSRNDELANFMYQPTHYQELQAYPEQFSANR